jgi:hypothetical protein
MTISRINDKTPFCVTTLPSGSLPLRGVDSSLIHPVRF